MPPRRATRSPDGALAAAPNPLIYCPVPECAARRPNGSAWTAGAIARHCRDLRDPAHAQLVYHNPTLPTAAHNDLLIQTYGERVVRRCDVCYFLYSAFHIKTHKCQGGTPAASATSSPQRSNTSDDIPDASPPSTPQDISGSPAFFPGTPAALRQVAGSAATGPAAKIAMTNDFEEARSWLLRTPHVQSSKQGFTPASTDALVPLLTDAILYATDPSTATGKQAWTPLLLFAKPMTAPYPDGASKGVINAILAERIRLWQIADVATLRKKAVLRRPQPETLGRYAVVPYTSTRELSLRLHWWQPARSPRRRTLHSPTAPLKTHKRRFLRSRPYTPAAHGWRTSPSRPNRA